MVLSAQFPTSRFSLACLALMLGALCGCDPIDQRTFDPTAGRPPRVAARPLPAQSQRPVFLQIVEGTPEEDYGPAVERATKLALSRKNNILFIIQGIAPMQKTPEAEAQTLHNLTQTLTTPVAQHLLAAGARPIQLDMRASSDPTADRNMVRIYVR